jgi:Skp family chaperone for outer membrane proteins
VKRAYLFLAALVGLSVAVYAVGRASAQAPGGAGAPPGAAPTQASGPRVAVFNVAKLMKDFTKWQYFAVTMNNERIQAATELLKIKNEIQKMQEAAVKDTEQAKIDQWKAAIIKKQREFEDREAFYKNDLDMKASKHLKDLFADVNAAVAGIVERNGYDIVFAYPEATTAEEASTQEYIDMKMRPRGGAMPFYVNKRADITDVMISTLNEYRKAPGPVPAPMAMPGMDGAGGVKGASGTTPADPRGVVPTPGGNR